MIGIMVNGEPRHIEAGRSLLELLHELDLDPARVAIELNRKIVRKPDWEGTVLSDGAALEIVQFVGGG